ICAEFTTGKVKWQDKCVGAGAVCYAEGRLYVHGEDGDAALVEGQQGAYREKGRFTAPGPAQHTPCAHAESSGMRVSGDRRCVVWGGGGAEGCGLGGRT